MNGNRNPLEEALRTATVPLTSGRKVGTGFFVTPDLVLTSAHVLDDPEALVTTPSGQRLEVQAGTYLSGSIDLVLLRSLDEHRPVPVQLGEPAQSGDQLLTYGYPDDNYRKGDSALLDLEGFSEYKDGTMLLKTARGRVRPGNSGGPVLNWRTGAVCGVVRLRDTKHGDTARLVPVRTVFQFYPFLRQLSVRWLDLLEDQQIAALGVAYPGPRLRRYLRAAAAAGDEHPYAAVLDATPPLSKVYLRQHASSDTNERAFADDLVRERLDIQLLGGPGAGKSSFVRHLAAAEATRWLQGERAIFVPVPIPAAALLAPGGLPDRMADGVTSMLDVDLDRATLATMFSHPPMPGTEWLVLVDGVDEVLNLQQRSITLNTIDRHRTTGHRFLVTSRPLSASDHQRGSGNGRYPYFEISPFDELQFQEFTRTWFAALGVDDPAEAAARFVDRVHRSKLAELAAVPLTATMMCVLHAQDPDQDIPVSRAELYDRFVDLLARRRSNAGVHRLVSHWIGWGARRAEHTAEDLLEQLHAVLARIAHDNLHGITGPLPERVAAAFADVGVHRPDSVPVDEWKNVLRELLRSSGLLVEKLADFHFIHQTLEEYLAACHLARGRRAAVKLLMPRDEWRSPELEIHLFLAARLIQQEVDISRALRRMLKRRHRRANLNFVLELERQGVPLRARVRRQLQQILVAQINDRSASHADWVAACVNLRNVDEAYAAEAFRSLAESDATVQRRLTASTILYELRPEVGLSILDGLSGDPRLSGADRLLAARTLSEADTVWGIRALTRVAEAFPGADVSLEAAQFVLAVDRSRGIQLLSNATSAGSSEVRLKAARMIGALDAEGGVVALTALVHDYQASADDRLAAAISLENYRAGASVPALSALALDLGNEASLRTAAVEKLAELSPHDGHEVRMRLVRDPSMAEERLRVAQSTGLIDPVGTARLLADLSDERAASAALRLYAAIAAAQMSPADGVAALRRLVRADVDADVQLMAASMAAYTDFSIGKQLLWGLVEKRSLSFFVRFAAAEQLCVQGGGHAAMAGLVVPADLGMDFNRQMGEWLLLVDRNLSSDSRRRYSSRRRADMLYLDTLSRFREANPGEALKLFYNFINDPLVLTYHREFALERLTPNERSKMAEFKKRGVANG